MLLEGLEDKEELTCPGEFKDLEMQKSIQVEAVEGLHAMITSVITGDASSSFLVQHKCVPPGVF